MEIIGRKKEIEILEQCYNSPKSEFVGIFGRRRVGKTFLIREVYGERLIFHVTGKYKASKKEQLKNFYISLRAMAESLLEKQQVKDILSFTGTLRSWDDAFFAMRNILKSASTIGKKKRVIFIDELPWIATGKSDFLSALEHFWNDFAAWEHNIVLVICGSATSWMVDKIIDNHGGLHNRLTKRIHLMPFTLLETEQFLQNKGIHWNRYQITECYMMMGGIPYYLDYIPTGGETPAMAIDQLFFTEGGVLREEYDNLYASLYSNAKVHIDIVEALSKKNIGLTRQEIADATRLQTNGSLTKYLNDLIACGFIRSYQLYGNKSKGTLYQLIDPYTLFYLRFINHNISLGGSHWQLLVDNPSIEAWRGYAFEMVCMLHIEQIRSALGFGSVSCPLSSWRTPATDDYAGAQIDIVIDRRDQVINLCEAKFSMSEFSISADYEKVLRNKINAFRLATKTHSALHLTMITTYGIVKNSHSGIVAAEIDLNGLFR